MIFERFECFAGNSTKVEVKQCWANVSRVGRSSISDGDRINLYMEIEIVEPFMELYMHTVVYYKYRVFKKFPVDVREDVCGWLNKRKKSLIMDWTIGRVLNFINYGGNLTCPLMGNLTVNFKNMSLNERFPMGSLLPIGNYRIDTNFTEADQNSIIKSRFFATISDAHDNAQQ